MSWDKGITTPKGFRAAAGSCGIKPSGKPDLALIVADQPCAAAGVFTTNRMVSPSVVVARRHVRTGLAQAIICNSGISNAATGKAGEADAMTMCRLVARHVSWLSGGWHRRVLPCSTGVIGPRLPMDQIQNGVIHLATQLHRGPDVNEGVARAILTTDMVPKTAHRSLRLGKSPGKLVHLGAIGKGSGMIAPNMATMLVFITTDAHMAADQLKSALKQAIAVSFNRISIDQHTSPSDSVLALASGRSGHGLIDAPGDDLERFTAALTQLCRDLAYQIVKDGEGATKVFRVRVVGAKNQLDADRVAKAVADSPLVKTAVHGSDPNWGRVITAVGYSGAAVQPDKLSLFIAPAVSVTTRLRPQQEIEISDAYRKHASKNGVCVYHQDTPVLLNVRAARRLSKIMVGEEIVFMLDLGLGDAVTEWLGCDLSRDYVTINADYTT